MGPKAREVLQAVTVGGDLSTRPFLRHLADGRSCGRRHPVRALRVTLCWANSAGKLHFPVECAVAVYDALIGRQRPDHGIANAGYRAISLRLRSSIAPVKRHRAPTISPLRAGMGWALEAEEERAVHGAC